MEKVCSITKEQIWEEVRKRYTSLAQGDDSVSSLQLGRSLAEYVGYPTELLDSLPESAVNFFSGTGNPLSLVSLDEGMVVLDIGSGPGMDCIIAGKKVGSTGKVIGIDMTEAMLERAQANREIAGLLNIEFRKGQAEDIPVENNVAHVVISNGMLNLCPCKETVLREAYRVLRPGGTLAISDVFLQEELSQEAKEDINAWTA
jgi:SAM-dependent methyltransferase